MKPATTKVLGGAAAVAAVMLVMVGVLMLTRYQYTPIQDGPSSWRLDRWTGQTTLCLQDGTCAAASTPPQVDQVPVPNSAAYTAPPAGVQPDGSVISYTPPKSGLRYDMNWSGAAALNNPVVAPAGQ